jgi:hypothetical protein
VVAGVVTVANHSFYVASLNRVSTGCLLLGWQDLQLVAGVVEIPWVRRRRYQILETILRGIRIAGQLQDSRLYCLSLSYHLRLI